MKVPIEVSARHIHLTNVDYQTLFGNQELIKLKELSQPNQFAAKQVVTIIGPKNKIEDVRVIGPYRDDTQLEISITDAYFLGIDPPPVLVSGNLGKSAGGLTLKGPRGEIKMGKGIIIAKRHLHISPEKAKELGLTHLQEVKINVESDRALIFDKVVVRSRDGLDKLAFQIDTDEANASGVKTGNEGKIIK